MSPFPASGQRGATFAEAELVVVGYNFTFAIGLITGGRLGDILGQRRMFLAGFVAFTLTSALCGLAPGPHTLIVARLLQRASASPLSPQVFSRFCHPSRQDDLAGQTWVSL
jgi:MFS family permease